MAKSAAERKREERQRMRKLGFKPAQVWVHAEDWPRVRRFVDRLNKRRLPSD